MVTNSFGNRNFMQPMGWSACTHDWPWFFFLGGEGGVGGRSWGELFFVFLPSSILPLPLAQAKSVDQQFWKSKLHASNGLAEACTQGSFWAGVWGEGFCSFSFVLNMFPSSSQCVPQGCSQWHLALIPYVLPIVLSFSPIYRWANGEALHLSM